MTRRKSRNCCIFKYFLDKYFKYLFEKGASAQTWILDLSLETVTFSPKLPVLPTTLILLLKNFSKSFGSMMLSSEGCWQSTVNFIICFLPLAATFFFRPLIGMLAKGGGDVGRGPTSELGREGGRSTLE